MATGDVPHRDPVLAEGMRRIRQYGLDDAREGRIEGVNARLDELQRRCCA